MNSWKIYFLFFTFSQIDIDFLSHKVHVMPHQKSGTWAVWSGSTFSFIPVLHSFATRCPTFNFCAISRHLCWYAFVNSRKIFPRFILCSFDFSFLIIYFYTLRLFYCKEFRRQSGISIKMVDQDSIWRFEVKHACFWWWLILIVSGTPGKKST